jgi:hypothetical protein
VGPGESFKVDEPAAAPELFRSIATAESSAVSAGRKRIPLPLLQRNARNAWPMVAWAVPLTSPFSFSPWASTVWLSAAAIGSKRAPSKKAARALPLTGSRKLSSTCPRSFMRVTKADGPTFTTLYVVAAPWEGAPGTASASSAAGAAASWAAASQPHAPTWRRLSRRVCAAGKAPAGSDADPPQPVRADTTTRVQIR